MSDEDDTRPQRPTAEEGSPDDGIVFGIAPSQAVETVLVDTNRNKESRPPGKRHRTGPGDYPRKRVAVAVRAIGASLLRLKIAEALFRSAIFVEAGKQNAMDLSHSVHSVKILTHLAFIVDWTG